MRALAALAVGAGLAIAPAAATAASCCGGASATRVFVLPKWEDAMAGAVAAVNVDVDQRNAAGDRLRLRSYRVHEERLIAGGAVRLWRDGQGALSVPGVVRTVHSGNASSRGGGLGDLELGLRWELLDEDTCYLRPFRELAWDEMKPSVHVYANGVLPTGRSTARSDDVLGADVTGRGFWVADVGVEASKVWGVLGNALDLSVGHQWPEPGAAATLDPAWRWRATFSQLFYVAYQRFVGFGVTHQQERWRGRPVATRRTSTDVSAFGSMTLGERKRWWLRGSAAATGVQGRSSFVGASGTAGVLRLF